MINFIAQDFIAAWDALDQMIVVADSKKEQLATPEERDRAVRILCAVHHQCCRLHLEKAKNRCNRLIDELRDPSLYPPASNKDERIPLPHFRTLLDECARIKQDVYAEISDITFTYIPREKAHFFQNSALFDLPNKPFLASQPILMDIQAAGTCLAVGQNTAAVFHLMRVAEFGLHKLVQHLNENGVPVTLNRLIQFETWGTIIDAIGAQLTKLKRTSATPAREEELQFYSHIVLEIQAFQHAWRNPVMHARFENSHDAAEILTHVKQFMTKLADRVPLN